MRASSRLSSKWDQHHLDRTHRVLQPWTTRDPAAAMPEAAGLRQAIADADWDAVVRHGGLDAAMRKFHQWYQENPMPKGRGSIDDFRLWGSRPCRRMGGALTRGGWRRQVVHAFDNHKSALSEGEALAVVVQAVPGNPHWTWVGTDSPNPLRQSVVRRRLALSPPRTARRGAAREGEEVEGATPPPF